MLGFKARAVGFHGWVGFCDRKVQESLFKIYRCCECLNYVDAFRLDFVSTTIILLFFGLRDLRYQSA